ncbi:sodium channel protein Nach-like [Euwallacea similis]|uniref:sodium channel protein Nach-like n=1 Tax=Euwallacea similis TaxID=1736056 RepID=UPI00344BECDF
MTKKRPFLAKVKKSYGYLKTSYEVQTKEFFENSTLHGVKYIAQSNRPFIERSMWFTCVTMGTVATCVVIFSLWDKFQNNPTITGLDTDFHNWLVPFPAVTLCPTQPASLSRIAAYLKISENETKNLEIFDLYAGFSKLSLATIPEFSDKYEKKWRDMLPKEPDDLAKLILHIADKCEDIFDQCKFKNDPITCCRKGSPSFHPVLTENGFCYSFNSMHFQESSEEKFHKQYIKETDIKWSLEFSAKSPTVSMLLYIINSDEMIGIDVQPQLYWDSKIDRIQFSFKETYTTEDTRQLTIKQRRCIFEDEIKLKIDNTYTFTACTIQCRMDSAKFYCGCVPFFYPKVSGFPHCNVSSFQCISTHMQEIKDVSKCDCQLGCRNTVYEVETQKIKSESALDENKIEIGFVSWPMVRYKREVLFGWVDLLVSFGGIAGLFLGFSLLSGVEIIYYFTIRAFIAAFRERKYLNRIRKEKGEKAQPAHDLSMTPYFIAEPLPGRGIDIVVKRFRNNSNPDFQYGRNFKGRNNNGMVVEMVPPFGIEFVN